MSVKLLTEEFANKVYDILVSEAGAIESERNDFIYHHCTDKYGCSEWRFQGKLGFDSMVHNAFQISEGKDLETKILT